MSIEIVGSFKPRGKGFRKGGGRFKSLRPTYQAEHAARIFTDSTVPTSASIENLILSVLDQGQEGSCVLNGLGQSVRCCMARAGLATPYVPSRNESYAFARLFDGSPLDQDTGTFIHTGAAVYQTLGFGPELVPYSDDPSQWSAKPTAEYERTAFDQAARTETSIHEVLGTDDTKIAAIQRALSNGFPVVWAGDVSQAFAQGTFDPKVPLLPPLPADIDGGHCMMLSGYNPDGMRIVNSWSTSWGDAGFFLASLSFILSAAEIFIVEHVAVEGVTA